MGAFAVSFLALRDLMQAIGYSNATAWIFPAIIDTAVAVRTMMLVALGDKPARRAPRVSTQTPTVQRAAQTPVQSAKPRSHRLHRARTAQTERVQNSLPIQPDPAQTVQDSAQTDATQDDADLASDLIASGVTTQPVETVTAVLATCREGASINAAAKVTGINYRTAQRIVEAAAEHRERELAAVG